MFTKRVRIIYAFLFLFAFTFGLSFTLASKAQAWHDPWEGCCVISYCPPPYQTKVQQYGRPYLGTCVQNPGDPCNWTFICGPE
jgi:hypothetical protein